MYKITFIFTPLASYLSQFILNLILISLYIPHQRECMRGWFWTASFMNYSSSSIAAFIHSFFFGRQKIKEEPSAVPHKDQVGD